MQTKATTTTKKKEQKCGEKCLKTTNQRVKNLNTDKSCSIRTKLQASERARAAGTGTTACWKLDAWMWGTLRRTAATLTFKHRQKEEKMKKKKKEEKRRRGGVRERRGGQ